MTSLSLQLLKLNTQVSVTDTHTHTHTHTYKSAQCVCASIHVAREKKSQGEFYVKKLILLFTKDAFKTFIMSQKILFCSFELCIHQRILNKCKMFSTKILHSITAMAAENLKLKALFSQE